eukprot:TRINITY_DN18406_c1_g1_i3.p1 TRINITY_DN18406_c1_g1~~TRINITY_DN18406_c1_g1_i3.p1  ORF type:complete len:476 (-),score=46.10 TRINITY_DN18406_c1_g1_i3:46-1473(-)
MFFIQNIPSNSVIKFVNGLPQVLLPILKGVEIGNTKFTQQVFLQKRWQKQNVIGNTPGKAIPNIQQVFENILENVNESMQRAHDEAETPFISSSFWNHIPQAPLDPILGLNESFKQDSNPNKLNLGVGAYRTEEGRPYVLNVVRKAEELVLRDTKHNKEYLPIQGLSEFNKLSRDLAFGEDCKATQEERITTVQSLSGTGALRIAAEFLAQYHPVKIISLPSPTWGNHKNIFPRAGLEIRRYRYYDKKSCGLDYEGLLHDLQSAEIGSLVLLHACAHNPTGVDPTLEQWDSIMHVCRQRRLLPFFDSAYQGFATGDIDNDASALRLFASHNTELLLAQSYAKNMGLYGERVGALSVLCNDAVIAKKVESQLKQVIRGMYSNPPRHGAEIVVKILQDPCLFQEWKQEVKGMSERIQHMRGALHAALVSQQVPGNWNHILKQIGMFSFTGMNAKQVKNMLDNWHIYMTSDGISNKSI